MIVVIVLQKASSFEVALFTINFLKFLGLELSDTPTRKIYLYNNRKFFGQWRKAIWRLGQFYVLSEKN